MDTAQHCHDIPEHVWELLEPHLPGWKGSWGGKARDNRQFINAVFWILRTGAPWRDLPPSYGDWKNAHRRFCRWRDKGVWESLLACLIDEADHEWLMIDASHVKTHTHGTQVRVFVTEGSRADCAKASGLIEGIDAQCLLADRGCDTNGIVERAEGAGMQVVIPPEKNRKVLRPYDEHLYRHRHLVENAFMHLKRWRGIATRYAKNLASFVAAVQIRCIALWIAIL
ncbi:MAG: IS5 family transposase [Zoogloeaceae bacterium]|jgi:transposase|nr:IS5 family transposase [Zoogloeaceae bacterium]